MNPETAKFYSRIEAARILNVSTRSLDRMIRAGLLKAIKIGRLVRISSSEIKKLGEENILLV